MVSLVGSLDIDVLAPHSAGVCCSRNMYRCGVLISVGSWKGEQGGRQRVDRRQRQRCIGDR